MSFTRDLLEGLATELNNAGVATYAPTYAPTDTGIFFKELPAGQDRAVALTAYATSDQPKIALSVIRVQFWFRGKVNDSVDVDDLADSVFNVMQGIEHRQYGTAHVVQALRVSSIALGVDGSRRHERSDNYELPVNVPTTSGRPE